MKIIGLQRTIFLAFSLVLLLAVVPTVLALPAFQEQPPCEGYPECYEEPPPPPEETSVPEPESPPQESSWEGYSDGRLNPDMAEYYSVWCQTDLIHVMRGVPSPDVVTDILLTDVLALSDGGSFVDGNNVTVIRTGDTITLYGDNGNLAPQHGSKSFSLSDCISRNGGAPPSNSVPPAAPQNAGDDPNAFDSSQCLDQLFLNAHLIECGDAPDNGISFLWRRIDEICLGMGIVPTTFLSVAVFRIRRKRK